MTKGRIQLVIDEPDPNDCTFTVLFHKLEACYNEKDFLNALKKIGEEAEAFIKKRKKGRGF